LYDNNRDLKPLRKAELYLHMYREKEDLQKDRIKHRAN